MASIGKGDGTIIRNGRLDFAALRRLALRPRPFTGTARSFWNDPYVSKHLLNAHLDPDTDDATRRPHLVERTVEEIMGRSKGSPRLLDLACGPGIYSERFARLGASVVGIDFSKRSIDHARASARKARLRIEYRCEDLRTAKLGGPYDTACMIFGEFGTLSDAAARSLLKRVAASMEPGGLLAFDVFTRAYALANHAGNDWYTSMRNGFWHHDPHVVLEQSFHYPERSATLRRYTVVTDDGSYTQYLVWWRYYTVEEITAALKAHGFAVQVYGNLWCDTYTAESHWIGLYCRRQ